MLSLFIPLGLLVVSGLVTLSAVSSHAFHLQLIWVALGAALVFVFTIIDWRSVFNHRSIIWGFYGLALLLMLAAYLKGPVIRNTRSWLVVGPFTLQPVDAPADDPDKFLRTVEHIGSDRVFLFSTDYPHWHFDGDDVLPNGLPETMLQRLLVDNALETYPRLAQGGNIGQKPSHSHGEKIR